VASPRTRHGRLHLRTARPGPARWRREHLASGFFEPRGGARSAGREPSAAHRTVPASSAHRIERDRHVGRTSHPRLTLADRPVARSKHRVRAEACLAAAPVPSAVAAALEDEPGPSAGSSGPAGDGCRRASRSPDAFPKRLAAGAAPIAPRPVGAELDRPAPIGRTVAEAPVARRCDSTAGASLRPIVRTRSPTSAPMAPPEAASVRASARKPGRYALAGDVARRTPCLASGNLTSRGATRVRGGRWRSGAPPGSPVRVPGDRRSEAAAERSVDAGPSCAGPAFGPTIAKPGAPTVARAPLGNRARPGRPARCPGGRFPWATGGAGPRTELPVRAPLPTVAPSTSNLQGRPAPSPRATGRVGRAGEGPRGSARTVGGAEGRARERGPVELDTADPLARVTRAPGCRSCPRPPSARAALFRRRAAVGPSTGRRTSRTRAVWRRSFAAGRPWAAAVPRASRVRRRKRVAEAASTAATDLRTVGSSGEARWRSAQARGLAPSPACCPARGSAARLPEPAAGAARERSERAGRRRGSSAVPASSECGLASVPIAADLADHGRSSVNGRGPFPCRTARRRGGAAPACRRVHARG
jgi:hypothetical protein